jgi:hypothetical protein
MSERLSGTQMTMLWLAVLISPVAWSVSLAAMFWLVHPVCQGAGRGLLWVTGGVCAALALIALVGSGAGLAKAGCPPERQGIAPFMLRLAACASAIFALVILLSMVPIALLTPCPV